MSASYCESQNYRVGSGRWVFSWNPGLSVDGMIEGLEVSSQHHQTSQNIHHRENLSSGQGNNATSQDLPKEISLFYGNLGW